MNETELRAKIASADAVMLGVIRSAGEDWDNWGKADGKTFDKAAGDAKAAKRELEQLTGSSDSEQRLEGKIARLGHEKFERRESVLFDSTELQAARSELDRLQSIRLKHSQAPIEALDLQRTNPDALRTAAMSLVESEQNRLTARQVDFVDGLLRGSQPVSPQKVAQRIIATGTKA